MNDYDTPEIRCSLRNLSRVTEWLQQFTLWHFQWMYLCVENWIIWKRYGTFPKQIVTLIINMMSLIHWYILIIWMFSQRGFLFFHTTWRHSKKDVLQVVPINDYPINDKAFIMIKKNKKCIVKKVLKM